MTTLPESAPPDMWLDRLIDGRYRVQRWLGADDTHTLLECVQVGVSRVVTLRVLKPGVWEERAVVVPFGLAGRQLAEVKHPRLASILDVGTSREDGSRYIVLEPVSGRPLREFPAEALSFAALRELATGVLGGLGALHDAGLAHGDIRPETIWVAPKDGNWSDVTLVDGLARSVGPSVYRAPEGPIDGRSDLYGLGRVIFDRVVACRAPMTAMMTFATHCCHEEPTRRFASVAIALEALEASVADESDAAPETVRVVGEDYVDNAAIPTVGIAHVDVAEDARVRQLVVAAMASLGKAFRSFAIYPENNPMLPQLAEDVCRHFDVYFEHYDRLDVWVDRFSLRFKRVSIYEDADVRGSYPFRLYADGIRKLSFAAGLGREEVFDYLACLRRAAEPGNPTIDLVTVMWEKRFPHIFCRMVEDLVPPPREELGGILGSNRRGSAWNGVEVVARLPAMPDFSAWRPSAVEAFLSRDDVAVIGALTREEAEDDHVLHYVIHVIAAMVLSAGTTDADVLRQSLSQTLSTLDERRDYVHMLQAVLAIREVLARAPSEDVRVDLEHVLARVSGVAQVQRMVERVRVTGNKDEVAKIAQLLAQLEPDVVTPIVDSLDTVPAEHLPAMQMALFLHCKTRPWQLASAVRHVRPSVARAAVRILRQIQGPRAASELFVALEHTAPEVRLDALHALQGSGAERLHERLPDLLRDPSPAVRMVALGACADSSPPDAVRVLAPLTLDPELRTRPPDELNALFRVLSAVGDEAVSLLAPLVTDRPDRRFADRIRSVVTRVFNPRKNALVFQLAVRALLQIDTQLARDALDVAQASRWRHRRHITRMARAAHARRVT